MKKLIFAFTCLFLAIPCMAKTIYLDADAPGANNGQDWDNAYNYLQDALAEAAGGDEIWVAKGVYKPDQGIYAIPEVDWRLCTFQLINGVTIKGGYAGFGQPDPNAHDIKLYETILDGDLNGNDREVDDPCDLFSDPCRAENSYHVVFADDPSIGQSTVLDGFTITNGNATRSDDYGLGGGIYCYHSSPTIRDCVIKGNAAHSGGGMFNKGDIYLSLCYPTLIDCTFSDNSALVFGGGIYNYMHCHPKLSNCTFRGNSTGISGGGMSNYWYSHPKLTKCAFYENHAENFYGGGMDNFVGCNPKMTNCVFSDNSSGDEGGGMYNDSYCDPVLINCTFSKNESAAYGGGICNYSYSDPVISNCIFWDNKDAEGQGEDSQIRWGAPIINYSCVEGWTGELGGDGNIDDDPCFADAEDSNYHLTSQAGRWDPNSESWVLDDVASPCIDAGNPGCPVGDEPSPNGNRRNMGAYGGTAEASKSPANWRGIADLTNDWVVDSNDLRVFIDYWLETGECIPSDLDRSQSVDFNDFAIFGLQWSYPSALEPGITYQIEKCDPNSFRSLATEQAIETRFTILVEGRYIRFEDMMVANCCTDELGLEMRVEEKLITIYEIEYIPGVCFCICDYPVTATLGPFEPGTYILEVYEDWGGFIGSTTVVIDPPE